MGRHSLKWEDCELCDQRVQRLAVFHETWSSTVQVVLLGLRACRAEQAAQTLDPAWTDAARTLQRYMNLPNGAVVVDRLLACGAGDHVNADHVAACAERFLEQPRPQVVVLVGERTYQLAEQAGLVRERTWEPWGSPWSAPVVFVESLTKLPVAELAKVLGSQVRPLPEPVRLGATSQAALLLRTLGRHQGHRRKRRDEPDWRTRRTHALTERLIVRHLDGDIVLSAFHPQGHWRHVVIDIDRHNALQAKAFDKTVARIQQAFPSAIAVQSSSSGGVHLYVRLPEGTTYEEGALVVRYYLGTVGLLWFDGGGARPVRTLLAEVPTDPPRLPFGHGSTLPGDLRPIGDQVQDFCSRLGSASEADYVAAYAQVQAALGRPLRGTWSATKARRLRAKLDQLEVANLAKAEFEPGDPFAALELEPSLRKVAAWGIPAYGTRTRWTMELAKALGERLPPGEAADVIETWLRSGMREHTVLAASMSRLREHVSSDLNDRTDAIIEDARKLAADESRANGVAERIWSRVDSLVRQTYADITSSVIRTAMEDRRGRQFRNPAGLNLDDLRRTAFDILRLFLKGTPQYRHAVRRRSIGHGRFGKYVGKNAAHDAELALTNVDSRGRGWLTLAQMASVSARRARTYRLTDEAWPVRPHEPKVYRP